MEVRAATRFSCLDCSYSSEKIDSLEENVIEQHEQIKCATYKCSSCNYSAKSSKLLTTHCLAVHSIPTFYKCSMCPYETKRKNDMPKHMLAHYKDAPMFKCPICPYQTKRKCDLPKHTLCHKPKNAVKLYLCQYCGYATKRKGDLPKHVKNHSDNEELLRAFQCSECEYAAKRKPDLNKHMLTHCDRHTGTNGVLKCRKCVYSTNKTYMLAKHILSGCKVLTDHISDTRFLEGILDHADNDDLHVLAENRELQSDMDGNSQPSGETTYIQVIPKQEAYQQNHKNMQVLTDEKKSVFRISLGTFSLNLEASSNQNSVMTYV
nr:unnamed protein product [Callosobruchus chinensis]